MIFVSFGGNLDSPLGSVRETADKACAFLEKEGVEISSSSSWFQTAPVPVSDQPWYQNRVFSVKTKKSPKELLETLLKTEEVLGRTRSVRNAARTIDLDLLSYGQQIINDPPDLIIPHPRMHLRAFVLFPLCQIAPDWFHPVLKKNVLDLINLLPDNQEIRQE